MDRRHASRSRRSAFVPFVALFVFGCVAFAARAAENAAGPGADGWYDASPPDGSFRVRGPVPFQAFTQEDEKDRADKARIDGVRASQAAAFDGLTKYVASCAVQPGDARSATARLDETLATWKKQAEFLYRRPVRNGKLDGIEFEIADPQKTLRVRVFAAPSRTCTLLVQWNHYAKPREDEIVRFLDSFALRKP